MRRVIMEKNAIQKTLIEIYKGYINDEKIKNEKKER